MPFCSRCGVEVEPSVQECPLCQSQILEEEKFSEAFIRNYPDSVISSVADELKAVTGKKNHLWELLSIFFLLTIISVVAIDWSFNKGITWSFYPIIAVFSIWGSCTVALLIKKHIILLFSDVFFLLLFLFLTDFYSGRPRWFFPVALPIVGLIVILSCLLFFAVSRIKDIGLNIAGFFLIAVSLFCSGLENVLAFYFNGSAGFSWSLVVNFSLVPIAVFLIYFHYRFTSGKNFKGFFHV
jgi:RNA polymerase subunit RPABC4/transcription elongation factor Spt4